MLKKNYYSSLLNLLPGPAEAVAFGFVRQCSWCTVENIRVWLPYGPMKSTTIVPQEEAKTCSALEFDLFYIHGLSIRKHRILWKGSSLSLVKIGFPFTGVDFFIHKMMNRIVWQYRLKSLTEITKAHCVWRVHIIITFFFWEFNPISKQQAIFTL